MPVKYAWAADKHCMQKPEFKFWRENNSVNNYTGAVKTQKSKNGLERESNIGEVHWQGIKKTTNLAS